MALEPTPSQNTPKAPGAVRVTVNPEIVDSELLPGWIGDRNTDVEAAVELAEHEQWIAVDIGGATYDYELTVTPMRDGAAVGEPGEMLRCDCNHAELMALVDERVDAAVAVLQSTPVQMEAGPEVEPLPEPVVEPPPAEETPAKRVTPLGIAGIATGAVGLGAIGGGVAMVIVGAPDTSSFPDQVQRNYRPPGYAALSVGVAALASSAAMLALDLTFCKRHPSASRCSGAQEQARSGRAGGRFQLSAATSPSEAGLVLRGRF